MKNDSNSQKRFVTHLLAFVFIFVIIIATVFSIQYSGILDFESIGKTEEETTETDSESTEEATEETIVLMEELVDEPSPLKVQELKQNARWTMGEIVALIILILALLLLLLFLLILWYRTIAIYAKDNNGQMQYMGRTWIHNREKHYEVDISQSVMERCETTYLEFRPSALFAKMHGGEEMHFLFPDGVCVTLPIAQKIEME